MSRWILPVAIALTITLMLVGANGQSQAAASVAAPHSVSRAQTSNVTSVSLDRLIATTKHRHHRHHKDSVRKHAAAFEAWRVWCKRHQPCLHKYSWTARGNPSVRKAAWRRWCLHRASCLKRNAWLHPTYVLTGPEGATIAQLPEGAYLDTFLQAANAYGVSPEILMAIGIVESGGGVAGTAYEGCMDYATFGSWPGQIYCAAGVLARVGLGGYNSVNPYYPSDVMGVAEGIGIIEKY